MSVGSSSRQRRPSTNGAASSIDGATAGLERFDPRDGDGKLIDSEHRGRYWWAAQSVAGEDVLDAGCGLGYGTNTLWAAGAASVLGLDIDDVTVAAAAAAFPELADSFRCADLCRLDLPDASFDVVVCFEAIQQVADPERALGELHRVLRPGGLLLISSPSPDTYSGNERHVHEYRPSELSAVVEERFSNVARYRQHPWLASAIEPADGDFSRRREVHATSELAPGAETYSILAAADIELPELESVVALGDDFEVKWWAERVAAAEQRTERAEAEIEDRVRVRLSEIEAQPSVAEAELRRALAQTREREAATRKQLRRTGAALLEAHESLAKLPALQHRYEELETLRAHVEVLEGSRSWRWLAPVRWLWRKLRLRR